MERFSIVFQHFWRLSAVNGVWIFTPAFGACGPTSRRCKSQSSVRSIQELVGLGIRFLSHTESIDTDAESPMSKFLLHLFAAFAEMEREI